MRWKAAVVRTGATQQRNGFLFFPKRIGNDIRWLERASWVVRAESWYDGTSGGFRWESVRWIT